MSHLLTTLHQELGTNVYINSYYEFFKWAFKILHPLDRLEDNFHIKYLCDMLQAEQERMERREMKNQDIIVNIPPRTSKSLICSVCFNAWVWLRDPTTKFICISYDDKLAMMNAQLCRDLITSAEYQALFKHKFKLRGDANAKSFFFTNYGGYRVSKTTGSNVTGLTAKVIVLDDPQNPLTVESVPERERIKLYYSQSLFNRLTPADLGIRIVVMQRLHQDDITGSLLSKGAGQYKLVCLPAELSELVSPSELKEKYTDGLLDPIRLNRDVLTSFKIALGSRGYAGQYGQSPASDEGNIVKKRWIPILEPHTIFRDMAKEPVHFYIDPAYTMKTTNDPTGILAGFAREGSLYVIEATEQWLEFPDLCRFIQEFVYKYGYSNQSRILVEPKASGKSIVQHMRVTTALNIMEGPSPEKDKLTRLTAKTPMIESGRLRLIRGPYVEHYMEQLTTFPGAAHDDMVDVTVAGLEDLVENFNPDFLLV